MRRFFILTVILSVLSGLICNASGSVPSKDVREQLRALHVECEEAYMRNDYVHMRNILDRSHSILDSLGMIGFDFSRLPEEFALYYKDEGSYNYCLTDMNEDGYQAAAICYLTALAIYEKYDDDPLKKAALNTELAQVYYKAGVYDEALKYLETNLEIYSKGWNEAAFRTLSEIALCKARLGRYEEALDDIDFAIEEGSRYDKGLEMIRKKGKILSIRAERKYTSDIEAADCFRRYFEAQKDSISSVFSSMTSAQRERYWLRMHPFITDCYRIGVQDPCLLYDVTLFSKNILLQFSDRRNSPVSITWQDIQSRLKEGECAIEFISYESLGTQHMAALILKKTGEPVFKYMYPTISFLGARINGFIMMRDVLESSNLDYKDHLYNNRNIGTLIWGGLSPYLTDVNRIYFAPDGVFHRIAIEYMFPEREEGKPEIHRLTGTRELMKERKRLDSSRMIMCGGMDFYESLAEDARKTHRNDRLAYQLIRDIRPYFTAIPNSLKEVDSIFVLRGNPDDCLLTGREATEGRCRSSFSNYPVVMVSTHGYFGGSTEIKGSDLLPCTSDRRLSESVLILSGAQKNIEDPVFDTSTEDGILSARELSGMDMSNVELFIASACQSGLGHITSDGVYGIQRGLKNAGVGAMIVSLWNVSDEATRYFMTNLNAALAEGKDLRDAFEYARERMDDEIHYEEWQFDSGRMRGEYVSSDAAIYSLPRYKNAFILIDNI